MFPQRGISRMLAVLKRPAHHAERDGYVKLMSQVPAEAHLEQHAIGDVQRRKNSHRVAQGVIAVVQVPADAIVISKSRFELPIARRQELTIPQDGVAPNFTLRLAENFRRSGRAAENHSDSSPVVAVRAVRRASKTRQSIRVL